jgi:hypothetical protein
MKNIRRCVSHCGSVVHERSMCRPGPGTDAARRPSLVFRDSGCGRALGAGLNSELGISAEVPLKKWKSKLFLGFKISVPSDCAGFLAPSLMGYKCRQAAVATTTTATSVTTAAPSPTTRRRRRCCCCCRRKKQGVDLAGAREGVGGGSGLGPGRRRIPISSMPESEREDDSRKDLDPLTRPARLVRMEY